MNRPSWDRYFLDIAEVVSRRATCSRLSVGAVAVRNATIKCTGYNGVPHGEEHCWHAPEIDTKCTKAIHAEANIVLQAAFHGIQLSGCIVYVTHTPCSSCLRLLRAAGVRLVIYEHAYGPDPELDWVKKWDGV